MKSEKYGKPPDEKDCVEKGIPDFLSVKLTPVVAGNTVTDIHRWFGKPASVTAIARQLNRKYVFPTNENVKVRVPNYGTFLLGQEGWVFHP